MAAGTPSELRIITEEPLSSRYQLGDVVGEGSYGRAIKAVRIDDGAEVIVKQIRVNEMDKKAREEALMEAKLLAQFDHVNIVHVFECVLEVRARHAALHDMRLASAGCHVALTR